MEQQIAQLQSMLLRGAFDRHPFREDRDLQISEILEEAPSLATLALLLSIDPMTLGEQGRIDYMISIERHQSWLQPLYAQAIVAVAGGGEKGEGEISSEVDQAEREEVAAALRISPTTAQSRIDVARVLVHHLPQTCTALASGEISPAHATVIAREADTAIRQGLPSEAIAVIEQSALAHAEFHTPGQVGKKVRAQIAQMNPLEFAEEVEIARAARRVTCYEEKNGMSTVVALLPAEDAQIVMKAIEAFIAEEENSQDETHESDVRTTDQKRADALARIAERALVESGEKVHAHRRPFTVNLTIDLPTLMGLQENRVILLATVRFQPILLDNLQWMDVGRDL